MQFTPKQQEFLDEVLLPSLGLSMEQVLSEFGDLKPNQIVSRLVTRRQNETAARQATEAPSDSQVESVIERVSLAGDRFSTLVYYANETLQNPFATKADFSKVIDAFERCGVRRPTPVSTEPNPSPEDVARDLIAEANGEEPF
jgi:hypothetical protein